MNDGVACVGVRVRDELAVILSSISGAIPTPVSVTVIVAVPGSVVTVTRMAPPLGVYLIALVSTFANTCSSRW